MPAFLAGLSPKLIGGILGGLAIAIFIGLALHWKHQAADRGEKLVLICQTTRTASDNPKLACGQVAVQIAEMGKTIGTLNAALDKQNAAVKAMGAETVRQQAEAERAVSSASTRARGAEATAERLIASSRSGGPPSASCPPSKALTEAWK